MRQFVTYLALAATLAIWAPSGHAQAIRVEQSVSGELMQFPAQGRELKTGTAAIRGRVYALETGQPIRRAQVRISGPDIMSKAALTDSEGRFEFRDLPAGRFTLQATKSGYVSVQFGQTRPYESGRPIELLDKQVLENSDIAMPRGSVIAGRIVDEFGEPIPDVSVTAYRQSWSNGRRRLVPAPGRLALTNDLGQFRIYGLPPGDYYVSASLRGGNIEFFAMDMIGAARPGAGPSASSPSSGYAPTYFPGTPSANEAQKISLVAGQENHSADFSLVPVRLAKITGVVIGSDGKPLAGAMINAAPRGDLQLNPLTGLSSARTDRDGAFTLNGVAPGDYMLQANAMQITATTDDGGRAVRVFAMRGAAGADAETASLPITVAGEDLINLLLVTAKGGRATGRVTTNDGGTPPNVEAIRVTASPIDSAGPAVSFGGGAGAVKQDGTFELTGLAGARLIRAVALPAGWTLKSVKLDGQDITDTGAEFTAGESVTGLEVVLTNRTTSITGGVTETDGTALKDYTVVIFADDSELWRMPRTRWVTGVRPDQEGRFKVQNLPPGSYHAVAVDYIPQGEWGDPDLLERLKGKGRKFTLEEGGSEVLDLKLAIAY